MVGLRSGLELVDVDVLADGEGGHGHTNFKPPAWFRTEAALDERRRRFIEAVATTFLAGTVAESRHAGFANWDSAGFDLDSVVREWLLLLGPATELEERLRRCGSAAEKLVDDPANWLAIGKLANVLLKERRLTAGEAHAAAGVTG